MPRPLLPSTGARCAAIAVLLAGCGSSDAASDVAAVRDSAGITIVENPSFAAVPEWTLAPPAILLGGPDRGEAYELYQALHALVLPDGGIVVANQGTEELRFFGPDGAHLRTVGRKGGGPGEFEGMWGLVRLPGDSLGVWDWTARRLTIFDGRGGFGRVVTPTAQLGFVPRILGAFPDGSFAVSAGLNPGAIGSSGGGLRDDSLTLLRLSATEGMLLDSLGPYPEDQLYVHMRDQGFWMMPIPFGRREHVDVADGSIHVGDDRTGEIRTYDATGRLTRIVRMRHDPVVVTDDMRARERVRQLAEVDPAMEQEIRARFDQIPFAETLPAFSRLTADPLGRLWVREFVQESTGPVTWAVLGADGRLAGRIRLPPRAAILDAAEHHVLVLDRDDLDTETISLHPIRRPEESE